MKARCDFALVRVARENVVISFANLCGSLALLFLTVSSLDLRKVVATLCGTAVRQFGELFIDYGILMRWI